MKITSQPTPNPNSLKFVANGRSFIEEGLIAAFSPDEVKDNALGRRLFALSGVESLLITPEFVTVTKRAEAGWKPLSEEAEKVLREWLEEA